MNERAAAADRDEAGQAATPGLLGEFAQLGRALKHLFGAHWTLFRAELSLARGAVSTLFVAALAATVAGVGLGLTLLALAGVALAAWFGSWLWALALLSVLQAVFLLCAIVMFRRGLHWLSLPATRGEFGAMMKEAAVKVRAVDGAGPTEAADPPRTPVSP